MTPRPARRTGGLSRRDAIELHRAWLELVQTEGPFLAPTVLADAEPHGMSTLPVAAKAALVAAKPDFDRAWDALDRATDREKSLPAYRLARDAWVDTVLRQVFGWGDRWTRTDPVCEVATVTSPTGTVSCTPTGALRAGDRVGALVWVVDPLDDLREPGTDGWRDSVIDRTEQMLLAARVRIGVVTDGRWWGLVSTADGVLPASGIVDAIDWISEPLTRDGFCGMLTVRRLLGGTEDSRLPALFDASVLAAEEVTDALGTQVRRAVELLVAAFDEGARRTVANGGADPLPDDGEQVYEAAVTVMMRVVFLLFAEERDLLPRTELFALGYGLAGELDALEERCRLEGAEALDRSAQTWHRVLATSSALYAGATFEDLRLPAYGGSLFDPHRFEFLTATTDRGTLAVSVSDRVLLEVLRSVQTAAVKGERRRISFRDIDVEQIGYIYEGLLGYTCHRAPTTVVGLIGTEGAEPEIPLDVLDDLAEQHVTDGAIAEAIIAWAGKDQPAAKSKSAAQLTKALGAGDDVEGAAQLLLAATDDAALRGRLRPWLGVIRRDLRGQLVVIPSGGWVVAETPSRRNAGAHYTPKALAEEVVLHALEPLVYSPGPYQTPVRDEWVPLSSGDLLELKVADIACGSGAFLVAAARYLAGRLVEAWQREGRDGGYTPAQLQTRALREVVAHCLYGADINAMAVEMCKLSLWLVSLDPGKPFSFVDDKIFHGNSLLGLTSVRQLEELHINPKPVPEHEQARWHFSGNALTERLDARWKLEKAVTVRERLASEVLEHDPMRSAVAKAADVAELHTLTRELHTVADGVIAAGLPLGGKPGKSLDVTYEMLRDAVASAYPGNGTLPDSAALDSIIERGLTPTVPTDYNRWQPLHWCLEVPDVVQRGGFDAIIGNPPFLGGQKLTGAMGTNMRDWFVNIVASGTRGSADLVAYFFLRAMALLKPTGTLGLIATNTIAQGDTREVGLDRMAKRGFTITRSIQSRSWPAQSANLEFAGVWGTRGPVSDAAERVADGLAVASITTLLEPAGRVAGRPVRLAENRGMAFQGCIVLGRGFVLDPDEAEGWIKEDPRNAAVLFPYLTGEDLNSRPDGSASRWVIDFTSMEEAKAATYAKPYERLTSTVKAERASKPQPVSGVPWWQFLRPRPEMRRALATHVRALAIARVSKSVMPFPIEVVSTVPSEQCVVVATDALFDQAVLSSSLHQLWAITYGSTLETRVRYTPSDVFDTFPRPAESSALERIGRVLDEERREVMLRRELGLTKLYNLINDPALADEADPDVARVRAIHTELDHVVMDAYGWSDVVLDHGFHTYRQMTRWTVSPAARVEILDRLLEENHRRAARQGDAPPPPAETPEALTFIDGDDA